MDEEENFGDYQRLSIGVLQTLLNERGLDPTNDKTVAVAELDDLDGAIDVATEELDEEDYGTLLNIALLRGFDPQAIPKENEPNATEDLLMLLLDYETNALDEDFLTADGRKRYNYAQRRYEHEIEELDLAAEEQREAALDAMFDTSPPITPRRVEQKTVNVANRGEPRIPQADIPARRVTALVTPTRRTGQATTPVTPITPVTPVRRNLPPPQRTTTVTPIRRNVVQPRPVVPQEVTTPPPITPRRNLPPLQQTTAPRKEARRPLGNVAPVRRIDFAEPTITPAPLSPPRRRNLPPRTTPPVVPRQIQFQGQNLDIPTVEQINRWTVDQLTTFLTSIGVAQTGLRRKADYVARALEMRDLLIRLAQDNGAVTEAEWNRNLPNNLRRRGGALLPGNIQLRTIEDIERLSVAQLKDWLDRHGINRVGVNTKTALVNLVAQTEGIVRTRLAEDVPNILNRQPTLPTLPTFNPFGIQLPPLGGRIATQGVADPTQAITTALNARIRTRRYGNPVGNGTFNAVQLADQIRDGAWYFNNTPSSNPIEYIMYEANPDVLANNVIAQLGLTAYMPTTATLRQKIDFLWDIYSLAEKRTAVGVTRTLLARGPAALRAAYPALRNLSDREIGVILYKGRRPFQVGQPNPQALAEIDLYTPPEIVKIVRYLIRPNNNPGYGTTIPQNSYYEAFLTRDPSPLIPFILDWQEGTDPSEVATSIGMIFPPGIGDDRDSLIRYFTNNVRDYAAIYTRPDPIDPPPALEDIPPAGMDDILKQYSDDELLDAYEITFTDWTSRRDFLAKIIEEATGGAKWSFRNRNCNNLEREDPITLEEPKVGDPTDPLISYGTITNYRCYNVSELVENFKADKDLGFVFGVPDWVNPNLNPVVLATFKYPLPDFREFPLASMKQLKRLLQDERNAVYDELKTKINEGINAKNNITRMVNQFREQYQRFSVEDQQIVQDYIIWLFLLGMYMRFWKGPGFVFPMQWVEGGGGAERCDLGVRDKNTATMFGTRTALLEDASPELEKWLLDLPRVRYDFRTGAVSAGQETINYIVEEAQLGQFCLADASDQILRTSYFYALRILNLSNEDFNNLLRETLQTPTQPAFDPTRVTGTGHTDPFHNLRDVDEE